MFYGKGLIIDKEQNRYKKYVSVLFFKIGDWEPLPKVSFIACTKIKGNQSLHSRGGMGTSVSLKVDLFCVYFFIDDKQKILVNKTKNKYDAVKLAEEAAKYLELPFKNYIKE